MLAIQKFLREQGGLGDLRQDPYNLDVKVDSEGRRVLFKYSMIESDMSLDICREARGLILDRKNDWDVVSYAYDKFFNAAENFAADIDWGSARIVEKLDGSLAPIYFYKGQWRMQTSGTIEGEGDVQSFHVIDDTFKGNTYSDLFWDYWKHLYGSYSLDELDRDVIYIFELCTPHNRIVKDYSEPKIVLTGMRRRSTLKEMHPSSGPEWLEKAKEFVVGDTSWQRVQAELSALEHDDEGFVIVDKYWRRVKVKQESYLRLHRMANRAEERKYGIIEIVQAEEHDDYQGTQYEAVVNDTKRKFEKLAVKLSNLYNRVGGQSVEVEDHESMKSFAKKVMELEPSEVHGLMFSRARGNINTFLEGLKESRPENVQTMIEEVTNH